MKCKPLSEEEIKATDGPSLIEQYSKRLTTQGKVSPEEAVEAYKIREELQRRLKLLEELAYNVRNGHATSALAQFPHIGLTKPSN